VFLLLGDINKSPDDASLQQRKGKLLMRLKRLEEAEQSFTKAAQLDPQDSTTFELVPHSIHCYGFDDMNEFKSN